MNNPPYILTDVFGEVVEQVRVGLGLPVLQYLYGYRDELNETLQQMSLNEVDAAKKLPLIWLVQPFDFDHDGRSGIFGDTKVRAFIMGKTSKEWKAKKRMDTVIKPVLIPIYVRLLEELDNHVAISFMATQRKHKHIERYWWDGQQEIFNDVVDCIEVRDLDISMNDNPNCSTTNLLLT